jgi:hypothetical protein
MRAEAHVEPMDWDSACHRRGNSTKQDLEDREDSQDDFDPFPLILKILQILFRSIPATARAGAGG